MKVKLIAIVCAVVAGFSAVSSAADIHYVTGSSYFTETDLKVAARSLPMVWERSYRSNVALVKDKSQDGHQYKFVLPDDGPLGFGWTTPWTVRIADGDTYLAADGKTYWFRKDDSGNFVADPSNGLILTKTSTGYELHERGGNTWVFNGDGRLLKIRDPRGNEAVLDYSGDRLAAVHDVRGRTVYTFDYTDNHITRVNDVIGNRSIDYAYSGGDLVSVSHDGKLLSSYGYNSYHGVVTRNILTGTGTDTWTIDYAYPRDGIASMVTDPEKNRKVVAYDFIGRRYTVTGFNGAKHVYLLDEQGKVVSEGTYKGESLVAATTTDYLYGGMKRTVDSAGNVKTEQLDEWESPKSSTDGEGNTTQISYNGEGKPETITDPTGSVTTFQYESGVYPTSITRAKGKPEQVTTTFAYASGTGDLQSVTTDGAVTSFRDYTDGGLPQTIVDPLGNVSQLRYDPVGNVTASIDAEGNETDFTYDWRGNVRTATVVMGDKEPLVTEYRYNDAGRLVRVIDPRKKETGVATNFRGLVTSVVPPAGPAKRFKYDGGGNLSTATVGSAVTAYVYDVLDRLTAVTDAEGNATLYEYATSGCSSCGGGTSAVPKTITDPMGKVTVNTLDGNSRITQILDPLQNLTQIGYDGNGRVKSRTDANGNLTEYTYDGLGRITLQKVTGVSGQTWETSFTYDGRGNLLTLTDPENNTTQFKYDLAGRKTKEIRPLLQETGYDYYKNGLLKTVTDAKKQTTTYLYDKANRLTDTVFNDGRKHSFGYDAAGNMTGYATPDVSGTIGYDDANRKTAESVNFGPFAKSFSYGYDGNGYRGSFTSPEAAYTWAVDKLGRPKTVTTLAGAIGFTYLKDRPDTIAFPNGITAKFDFYDNAWIKSIAATAKGNPLANAQYGYDKVGNITSKASEAGNHSYGYDDLYQLTGATIPKLPAETYTYDKVGNRKTSAAANDWTYSKNNELLSYDGVTFGYDPNGNTTTKTVGTGSGTVPVPSITTYVYDVTDRMTGALLPDGRTVSYVYDPFGRRIRKSVGSETTYYLYADEGLIGEYDAQGNAKKGYGWKPGGIWGTDPLFMTEGGKCYFYHNDHLGTPQKMTDQAGNVVWAATYEAFGEAHVDEASTVVNNLRFPGQYWGEEIRLHYNRYRYFSTIEGRYYFPDLVKNFFISLKDYSYSSNNPVVRFDNLGLYDVIFSLGYMDNNNKMYPATVIITEDGNPNKVVAGPFSGSIYPDQKYKKCNGLCTNIGPGKYGFKRDTFSHENPRYPALYIGVVPSVSPNIKHKFKNKMDGVWIHSGWPKSTYSAGCLTIYPEQWGKFISHFPPGSSGNVIIDIEPTLYRAGVL